MTDEERQWPYLRVWFDLSPALRSFAEAASPDLLPPDVASRILELTEASRHDEVFQLQTLALSATNAVPSREVVPGPGTATYRNVLPEPYD
jgi:hypothetical protein